MSLRFKKRFTFYKNAPFDASGVNVCATLSMHEEALRAHVIASYGFPNAPQTPLYEQYTDMNFFPSQTMLYAPHYSGVLQRDFGGVNYLKVEFFDPYVLGQTQAFSTYYYHVESVDECDVEEQESQRALLTWRLSLKMDVWATRVLVGGARFYGGELTRAGALTSGLDLGGKEYAQDAPASLPFEVIEPINEDSRIIEVFDRFSPVIQLTGKDLGRAVLIVGGDSQGLTKEEAIKAVQTLTTAKDLTFALTDSAGSVTRKTFNTGEFSVQGAYVIPYPTTAALDSKKSWYTGDGASVFYETAFSENLPRNKRVRLSLAQVAGVENPEEPFPPTWYVDFGTPFNRVNITEFFARPRNGELPEIDAEINTEWGENSFSMFFRAGGSDWRDVTNDFQIFSIVDPENDYIRQNKTNAILSGIGSVGGIITGAALTATGKIPAGLGALAGGALGLAGTLGGVVTAQNAPDARTGGGYGDVSIERGGFYYVKSINNIKPWARMIRENGIGRKIPLDGFWTLNLDEDETAKIKCNCIAARGVLIKGIPAGNAQEVAEMLQNGVRVWYDVEALKNMEFYR